MKQGNKPELKPKLHFPEYRDTSEWSNAMLASKVSKVGSGITPTGGDKNYKKEGRPFIRSQNVGWGELILDDVTFIDDATHATFLSTEIKEGDVLLNITGASIGRSAVADSRIHGGNVNQHVCVIRTITKELSPQFLNQYLLSQYGQKQIDSFQAGGNRQGLNFAQVRSFLIPLPQNIEEQQKIADCLTSLDELVSVQRGQLDALKAYKKGLLQNLFPAEGESLPRLRFPEFQSAGEWEEDKLGNISFFINERISLESLTLANYVSTENILPDYGGITTASKLPSSGSVTRFKVNDVLISNIRPYLKKVWLSNKEGGASNDVIVVRAKTSIDNRYLAFLLKNDAFIEYVMEGAKGVKMPRGDISLMKEYPLAYPSIQEQQKIAELLTSIDEQIAAQSQRLAALQVHKKGLLQGLFPAAEEA